MNSTPRNLLVCRLLLAAALLAGRTSHVAAANCDVVLNELIFTSPARVELFNVGVEPAIITGWRIEVNQRCFVITEIDTLAGRSYGDFELAEEIFDPAGMETSLVDTAERELDGVESGQFGGAPLPVPGSGASMARAPDAADSSLVLFPPNDAPYWTIDFTPTSSTLNDAPVPMLGSSILINEVDPKPGSTESDRIELYNPGFDPVDLTNWMLVLSGDPDTYFLGGTIGTDGWFVFDFPPGVDLDTHKNVYLFDQSGVRVDQIGWEGAPALGSLECIARIQDGQGPNDGWDFASSGLVVQRCSIGCSNNQTVCVLFLNGDGVYETNYAWEGVAVGPDEYGAFAERYETPGQVCDAVFDFTRIPGQTGNGVMDVYIWADQDSVPANVLAMRTGISPGIIDSWPAVTRRLVPMAHCNPVGAWWIGYRGSWFNAPAAWSIAIDTSGLVGLPKTKIAPGLPFPEGWQNLSLVVPSARAMGIGARLRPELLARWEEGAAEASISASRLRASAPLATGACCTPDGTCAQDVTQMQCLRTCGNYLGDGSDCEANSCRFEVQAVDPEGGDAGIDWNPPIRVDFSIPVRPLDVTAQNFHVRGSVSGVPNSTFALSPDGKSVSIASSFDPTRQFGAGELIECRVAGQVRSTDMIPLRRTHTWHLRTFAQRGTGFTTNPSLQLNPQSSVVAVEAGDLNRDGRVDLVACGTDGKVAIFQNTSDSTEVLTFHRVVRSFPSTNEGFSSVLLEDLDRDRDLDIVLADQQFDLLRIGRNLGTLDSIRVDWSESWPAPEGPQRLRSGDFNGDGNQDLFYPSEALDIPPNVSPDSAYVQFLDGNGHPLQLQRIIVPSNPFDSALLDLGGGNGLDGDLDGVLLHGVPPRLSFLHGAGAVPDSGEALQFACSIDIPTADGLLVENLFENPNDPPLPDAIVALRSGSVLVYKMRGLGLPEEVPLVFQTGLSQARGLAALDVDGDRDLDLAVTNPVANLWQLMFNHNGALTQGPIFVTAARPILPMCVDLNSDGLLDVVIPCKEASALQIWLNQRPLASVPDLTAGAEERRFLVHPNPFRGQLTFQFETSVDTQVRIYDVRGRLIRGQRWVRTTPQRWTWDGTDNSGRRVPSGIYSIRVSQPEATQTQRVVRLE